MADFSKRLHIGRGARDTFKELLNCCSLIEDGESPTQVAQLLKLARSTLSAAL
jgi:hypothetical protein